MSNFRALFLSLSLSLSRRAASVERAERGEQGSNVKRLADQLTTANRHRVRAHQGERCGDYARQAGCWYVSSFFFPSVPNAVYLAQAVVDFGLAERGIPSGGEADWAQPKRRRPRAAPTLRNRCFRTTTTTLVAHAWPRGRSGLSGWELFFLDGRRVPNGDEDGLGFALGPGVLSINIQRCHFHAVMSSARATKPLDMILCSSRVFRKLARRQTANSTTNRVYRVYDLTSRPQTGTYIYMHACMHI
jgi:hypothetical protein